MTEEAASPDRPASRHYVNYVSTKWDAFDITIDFGVQRHEEDLQWAVGVTMTWEEARVLSRILGTALENYERVVGEVRDIEGKEQPGTPGFSQNGGGLEAEDDEPEDPDDE